MPRFRSFSRSRLPHAARFGAQADALFGTVADTYEAGDETVEVSRTSLPQGGSVLLLRGWTLGGEDRCVMGSFQTAHRTLRSRAIWSTEIADDTLSVRWFDGQIWHDEPSAPENIIPTPPFS